MLPNRDRVVVRALRRRNARGRLVLETGAGDAPGPAKFHAQLFFEFARKTTRRAQDKANHNVNKQGAKADIENKCSCTDQFPQAPDVRGMKSEKEVEIKEVRKT